MKPGLLLLLLPLSGCMVGPDYHATPVPAPAAWADRSTSGASASDVTAWWRRFDDPILDRLIEQAVAANADVAQTVAKLRQARAALVQEKSGLLPTLDGSGSATRSRQSLASIGNAGSITQNSFAAGFDASFELDLFGGQRRGVESAGASLDAAALDVGDTILTLLGDVARYYVEARGYQARIAVAEDTLRSRTDTWNITRARAQGGTGTGLDALQARAETESAAAAIPPLEYDFRQSVNRLAVLTGQSPQDVLDRMRAIQPVPRVAGAIEPDPPVLALARRPDIRAAERRIAAASADIGVAQADRFPAVTLAGSVGVNSTKIRSLTDASANVWSFGPTFSLPIFDAGKRRAKVDEKVAIREERVAAWQATVRSALEETENALVALDRERTHNAALRRTVSAMPTCWRSRRRSTRPDWPTSSTCWMPIARWRPNATAWHRAMSPSPSTVSRSTRRWVAAGRMSRSPRCNDAARLLGKFWMTKRPGATSIDPTGEEMVAREPLLAFSWYLSGRVNVLLGLADEIVGHLDAAFASAVVDGDALGRASDLMWLWSLAAYEVIRTVGAAPDCFSSSAQDKFKILKTHLAEARMPSAKMEKRGKKIPVSSDRSPDLWDIENKDLLIGDPDGCL